MSMEQGGYQGVIDSFRGRRHGFLSNFSRHSVQVDVGHGLQQYATTEHAYQAAKSFSKEGHDYVAVAKTPGEAKKRGRSIAIRFDWEKIKDDVMRAAVMAKFSDPVLQERLVQTKAFFLKEGNNWCDNYWGDCSCFKCLGKNGKNMLGKILMEVRDQAVGLRAESV